MLKFLTASLGLRFPFHRKHWLAIGFATDGMKKNEEEFEYIWPPLTSDMQAMPLWLQEWNKMKEKGES